MFFLNFITFDKKKIKFGCDKISVKLNIVILLGKFPVGLHANCIFFKKYQHNESKGNLYRVSAFWRHLLPKLAHYPKNSNALLNRAH